jgi:uncharacterized protein (TIRG00374 family)
VSLETIDPPQNKTSPRGKAYRVAGSVIALVPLVWIFWRLDFHRLFECSRQVAWWTIPVLCSFLFVSMALQGARWWFMLRALIPDLSFFRAMSYHFIGVFYGIVLPTSASADVVKTLLMSRKVDYSVSWGATWVCRILGLLALAFLSIYGLFTIDHKFLPKGFWIALCAAFLVSGAVFALSFSKRLTAPFRPLFQKLLPKKTTAVVENIRQGIYLYRKKPGTLFFVFIVTLLTQSTLMLAGCFTLYGITGRLFIADYFAFFPIIEVIANAGPTPGGIGVREGLTAVLFNYLNVSKEQLGIYVFLALFFSLALKLLGGIPLLHGLVKRRRQKRTTSIV